MSHYDKVINKNPDIPSTGKPIQPAETVGDSLKIYSPEEAAFNIINFKCKKEQEEIHKNTCLGYSRFLPTESLKDVLSPEVRKSRFIAFKEKFLEDMFLKRPNLGKALELQSKPQQFTNENFIYGLKTSSSEGASDLISPNKTPHDVKQEYLKWHDKYLISHKDYFPSERIKRNYNENFNPHSIYGISKCSDKNGYMTQRCLQHSDRKVVINKVQKNFIDRTIGGIGKKIDRYNLNLDPHQTFGIQLKNQRNLDVRAIIENVEPSSKEIETNDAISYINKLRRLLFNRSDLNIFDLKILLNKYDENRNGFVTFNSIMKSLYSLQIHAYENKIRAAIKYFQILIDETKDLVSIEEFWKMLHLHYPLPKISTVIEPNKNAEHIQTTYQLLCCDRYKPVIDKKITRGLIYDDCTTAGDLISPDIPLHNGLHPSDFKVLRTKEELRRIFKRLLPQTFDRVWEFAWSESGDDTVCKMSVNDLKTVIDQYNNQKIN